MICTRRTSDWHGNAFTLSLIGYTSTCEITVRTSDWLYRLFSHVKIKRIDLYKWALRNKILVLCVIKHFSESRANETPYRPKFCETLDLIYWLNSFCFIFDDVTVQTSKCHHQPVGRVLASFRNKTIWKFGCTSLFVCAFMKREVV